MRDENLTLSFAAMLRAAKPKARVDDLGYARFDDCLVGGVDPATVRKAFPTADGRGPDRRQPRLYPASSATMLAVNILAPWLGALDALTVAGQSGFRDLRFEIHLPAIEGSTAQWLDALLVSPAGLIGIEAECADYLSGHRVGFADVLEDFWQGRARNGWRREMLALKNDLHGYARLDAARLIKQYMGLRLLIEAAAGDAGTQVPVTLLYLYWEPLNAARFDEFAEHRAEVDRFARAVAGSDIAFQALSCLDLWAAWSRDKAPKWLPMHLARLHQLYSFRI